MRHVERGVALPDLARRSVANDPERPPRPPLHPSAVGQSEMTHNILWIPLDAAPAIHTLIG
jgi:hypothetical protein